MDALDEVSRFAPRLTSLLKQSIEADREGDDEVGHSREDDAMIMFIYNVRGGSYSAAQTRSIASLLYAALTREDRGARWCA